ncbi:MAG: c-type cytochrome [Geminicoccaceae bacterium]
MTYGMLTLAALGVAMIAAPALADQASEPARAAAGEVLFTHHCAACHSKDTSQNAFGPQLHGVIGREAGTVPRFDYSDALKESGIVWDEDTLRAWMSDNDGLVPGTRMRHVAITDPAEQDFILAYIRSLGS